MPLQEYQSLKQITAPVYKWALSVDKSTWKEIQAIQNLNPDESMDLTESYVIGGKDGGDVQPFELVPGNVTGKSLDLSVVVLHGTEEIALSVFTSIRTVGALDWMEVMDKGLKFHVREQKIYKDSEGDTVTDTFIYESCLIARVSTPKNITGGDLREIAALTINYTRVSSPTIS